MNMQIQGPCSHDQLQSADGWRRPDFSGLSSMPNLEPPEASKPSLPVSVCCCFFLLTLILSKYVHLSFFYSVVSWNHTFNDNFICCYAINKYQYCSPPYLLVCTCVTLNVPDFYIYNINLSVTFTLNTLNMYKMQQSKYQQYLHSYLDKM